MLDRDGVYEPRGRALDDDGEFAGAGLIARISGPLLRHPMRTGSTLVLVGGAALIVANAVFFQTAHHPSPLFATRAEAGLSQVAAIPTPPIPEPMPIPRVRALTTPVPVPTAIPAAAQGPRLVAVTAVPPPTVANAPTAASAISEVQTALQTAGLYQGRVDGMFGARTRAAVEAYQRNNGLAVNGTVDDALLTHIRAALPPPAAAEVTAAIGETPAATRLRSVQTALNRIGYGPVRADGVEATVTVDAIRRFQLDNGLTVTGRADDVLVRKMVAIGALEPL